MVGAILKVIQIYFLDEYYKTSHLPQTIKQIQGKKEEVNDYLQTATEFILKT